MKLENFLSNPKLIWGNSPEQIKNICEKEGLKAIIQQSTKGSKLSSQIRIFGHPKITNIQIHPGGGRHIGSYYKISTSTEGIIKIVDKIYKPALGEKATIIYID